MRLGLTIVELVRREGKKIWVKYLDAIDGTPILDIKPVMKEFLPAEEIRQPKWSDELMKKILGLRVWSASRRRQRHLLTSRAFFMIIHQLNRNFFKFKTTIR